MQAVLHGELRQADSELRPATTRSTMASAIAKALVAGGMVVALSEVCVRATTRTNAHTGVTLLGHVALLPYRPTAKAAAAAWAEAGASTYVVRDDQLGWTIRPNGAWADYTATAQGFRGPADRMTTPSIPPGTLRISVYGDSFTHGDGVRFEETWPDQLQHLRPNLEVLNFGIPGYGADQALLRFRRDGTKFRSDIHVLAIWPEDLVRDLNVIRFYLAPNGNVGTSKPRFVLQGGALVQVNLPVLPRHAFLSTLLHRHVDAVVAQDFWYREDEQRFPIYLHAQSLRAALSVLNAYRRRSQRYRLYLDRDGEAVQLAAAISQAFTREVEALGARAYIAIIPMQELLDVHARGGFPLVDVLRARAIPVIDCGPAIAARARELGAAALYLPDGHLTAGGNRVIAEEVAAEVLPALAP